MRLLVPVVLSAIFLGTACSGEASSPASGASPPAPATVTAEAAAASTTSPAAAAIAAPAATAASAPASKPLQVVATTTQVADFSRIVGGNRAQVYGILKPNVDPHDYEPSPADAQALAKADLIVENGVGLEKWLDPLIKSAAPKAKVVDASQGVKIREVDGERDPHIWHNPQDAKIMVENIGRAMEAADPAAAQEYEANARAYQARLDTLDAAIAAQIDTLTNKKLVTNHDAFGYYVDRYGLVFVGSIIPSFDTSAELSAKDLQDIVAKIKAQHVKAVFSESSLPPKTAEAIAKQAGVKVVAGKDALYGDSLGPPGSEGATYLQMEEHNTKVIVENLR